MGYFLLPLGIFAGWVAGAAMSRRMIGREVRRLEDLIESRHLPAIAPPATSVAVAPPAVAPPETPAEIGPETILVLSAAVAAFLGKRARIRGVRLAPTRASNAWAQQGRVFVQASHNLEVMHGR